MTCGATGLLLLVIDSKAYVFNLGDNKGLLYRKDKLFQLSIDHIPVFVLSWYRVELIRRIGYNSKEDISNMTD